MYQSASISVHGNAGFTLLELIAVMVIMSILAVVAIPKYFDMQAQARDRAMDAAMAEAISRVNGYFAQEIINGEKVSTIDYTDDTLGTDLGDFTLEISDGGYLEEGEPNCIEGSETPPGCISLTVTPKPEVTALKDEDPKTRIIPRPEV